MKRQCNPILLLFVTLFVTISCTGQIKKADHILRNGLIMDGSGKPAWRGDVASSVTGLLR